MQASATKWVPGLFLSKETVQKIVDDSFVNSKLTVDIEDYGNENLTTEDEWANAIDGVKYIEAGYPNFKAYIMLIKDPSRVYTGTSSDDYSTATEGKRIFEFVVKENVLACINGGGFLDEGGTGTGAAPTGMTYSKGQCAWNEKSSLTFIGFDNDNKLVVTEGMSVEKAKSLGVRDGVSFKYGNVLIDSDDSGVNIYYKNKNTGAAQRTAIGQRADGTVIMVVTDGRTASSIGATYNDIIDIMVSYGAVSAGMLDGGSSAMMYYENYYEKYNIDKSKLDDYQKRGLVNKYRAFYPPRRIPTYFCVSR
jgi:exopolysaccharide biosynthesis protein